MSKFTGKISVDKNEGETMSSHSGLTKKSNVKGQAVAIASHAQQQFAGSPTKFRQGKTVDFEDDLHSPDFNRGEHKDGLADDPKRRTDVIDKHLAGEIEDLEFSGGTASL